MILDDAITEYATSKRANGIAFNKGEARLRCFAKCVGPYAINQITTHHIVSYFRSMESRSSESVAKYLQLAKFFLFWQVRGEVGPLAFPPRPTRVRQTFVPYIYTSTEVRALLAGTNLNHTRANCLIEPAAFRMFLILLYATGATVGELLALRRVDVSLVKRRIVLSQESALRGREIPIGDDLRSSFGGYLKARFSNADDTQYIFQDKLDRRISPSLAMYNFRRLCRTIKLRRRDGCDSVPRLLDFKTTFAVNRISAWVAAGTDLNRMLPALAAYMGQAGLGATESYLRLTPSRFNKPLRAISPKPTKTHWRDNPEVMGFLDMLNAPKGLDARTTLSDEVCPRQTSFRTVTA